MDLVAAKKNSARSLARRSSTKDPRANKQNLRQSERIRLSIQRAVRAAVLGSYRSGDTASARHGIGIITQFLQILAELARSGISF